ncbi:hypothetical protein ACK355_09550, partial [Aeromonas veronii]
HVEPPAFKIRENSTYEHLSFSGGLPGIASFLSAFSLFSCETHTPFKLYILPATAPLYVTLA